MNNINYARFPGPGDLWNGEADDEAEQYYDYDDEEAWFDYGDDDYRYDYDDYDCRIVSGNS